MKNIAHWTPLELRLLHDYKNASWPWGEITEQLPGRSRESCIAKWANRSVWIPNLRAPPIDAALLANPPLPPPPQRHIGPSKSWSTDEERLLIEMRNQGLKIHEIAARLQGRTVNSVKTRCKVIKSRKGGNAPLPITSNDDDEDKDENVEEDISW